ncbi:MAG: hypothetical protein WA268_29595 [Xanthobacteraceae bacterium]
MAPTVAVDFAATHLAADGTSRLPTALDIRSLSDEVDMAQVTYACSRL